MNLTNEEAMKLVNDEDFMKQLRNCIEDKKLTFDLFNKYGITISEEEYNGILKSRNKFSKCSEEELKEIAGGYTVTTTTTTTTTTSHHCPSRPMRGIDGVLVGGAVTLIGLCITGAGLHTCAKKGLFGRM